MMLEEQNNIKSRKMKSVRILHSLLLVLLFVNGLNAQDLRFIDSLQNILKRRNAEKAELRIIEKNISDSIDVNIYYKLSQLYWTSDPKLAMDYAIQCLNLAQKIGFKRGVGKAYNTLGVIEYNKGNFFEAIKYHKMALAIRTAQNDKRAMANSHNNIGNVNTLLSYFPEAIKEYFEALKIYEELKLEQPQATSFVNIGNIYLTQKNFSEALKYYSKCLSINQKLDDKSGLANVYLNIGQLYFDQEKLDSALDNFQKSLNYFEQIGEKLTSINCYNSIGVVHKKTGNFDLALLNFHQALKISQEFENKNGMLAAYGNIANTLTKQKKFVEAERFLSDALKLAKEVGSLNYLKLCYERFVELDSAKGNFKGALYNYRQFILYKDSITSTENSNKIFQTKMQYDFAKKESLAKAQRKEKDKVEKLTRNTLIVGLILLFVFGGFMFNRFKITQKQKNIITKQKIEVDRKNLIVETKNKEIMQSIEYALRIQTAILPSQRLIKKYLPNSFVLYKPKDIVAGDFYWIEDADDYLLFAACDCTGHGVPGAMVSVVCHNALNRAVREFGLRKPAAILDKTAEIVIENFSKSEEEIKDGMDISLCAYHRKTKTLEWAGANNPLWILQNGELKETKADKQAIAMNETIKSFTNHSIGIAETDTIYLFTDGFSDQFGGLQQKKLTKKRFKGLLLTIQELSLEEQGIALNKFITEFRKEIEQIDDILVMGVKV
jgi:tetratricopeptide (TPR) repeat protein